MSKAIVSRKKDNGDYLCVYPEDGMCNIEDLGRRLYEQYDDRNVDEFFRDAFLFSKDLYDNILGDINKFEWNCGWNYRRKDYVLDLSKAFRTTINSTKC